MTPAHTVPPNPDQKAFLDGIRKQAKEKNLYEPLAKDGRYYAYLSKVDPVPGKSGSGPQSWDVMFELVNRSLFDLALFERSATSRRAPQVPILVFEVDGADEKTLLDTLGIKKPDDVAEGSWFELTLAKGSKAGAIEGTLFPSDPPPADNYGPYYIAGPATPLSMPQIAPDDAGMVDFHGPPPGGGEAAGDKRKCAALADAYGGAPAAKRARLPDPGPGAAPNPIPHPPVNPANPARPVPPAAQVDLVGVMDVGQGNCNLLVKDGQPLAYFDVGFPPPGKGPSAPPTVQSGAQSPPCGPIVQNSTNDLFVVLSHWDWDHYQLGAQWPALKALQWLVPGQARGLKANEFLVSLGNKAHVYAANFPPTFPIAENALKFTLYRCNAAGLPRSAIMNNSGLAISAEIKLPANSDDNRVMMMPADASFRSIPVVAMPVTMANMAGLVAVHHGSRANYAADDLPVSAIGPGQGRLIYSYGIKPDGTHTHGFPTQEAMGKYDAAGWGMKRSTAQGNAITEGGQPTPYPLLLRGNMAIGGGPLAGEYANTAFGAFADRLD